MSILIINDDIELHPPKVEFASTIFQLVDRNRAYLKQWLPWVVHTNTEIDTKRFLKEAIRANKNHQQFHTIIFYKGEIVGLIGFNTLVPKHGKGEIGYWLTAEKQGLGIVSQACNRLLQYGFETLNLNKIIIRVASQNFKSQAIPKRLGFKDEGTLRADIKIYEQFVDMKVYGLLQEEWSNRNNS